VAHVEGDVADVDGVLRVIALRIRYELEIPAGTREKLDRVARIYAERCPLYCTVRDCVDVTWTVDARERV